MAAGALGGSTSLTVHRVTRAMNADSKPQKRKWSYWPVAGLVVGIIAATNPFRTPHITLLAAIAVWCAEAVLVLILSGNPIGARIGVLLAGLLLAVPFLVRAAPLPRFLLIAFMILPFAATVALVLAPPIAGFRARLAHLCDCCGKCQAKRLPRRFDAASLQQLVMTTAVFAAAIATVKAAPARGLWLPVRWLAGGIGAFALAEMATACHILLTALMGLTVPSWFQSPYRSASVGEFWAKRWNVPSSQILRKLCFAPLARHGAGLALFTTFLVSAIAHVLFVYVPLGRWRISLICGAFFLVQPLPIAAERWMKVRRWRPGAGRAWTLTVLVITSPLVVEPMLQIFERSWGAPDNVLLPTSVALGFVIVLGSIPVLASLASAQLLVKKSIQGYT